MNDRSLIYIASAIRHNWGRTLHYMKQKGVTMANSDNHRGQATKWRWVWIVFALGVLAIVGTVLAVLEDTADVARTETAPTLQAVSVKVLGVGDATAVVEAFAAVRPRWSVEIRTAVGGRVTEVRRIALAGERVPAGAVLFRIERVQYEPAVAAAELALTEARLALIRAGNNTLLARRQFERDSTRPPNDLALHLPQLTIAERGVALAEAQLRAAQQQLADATITAPFSGFVTERLVSLGQTVGVGEPLVKLIDDAQFEMTVAFSRESWALLDHPIAGQVVRLQDIAGNSLGNAHVRQGGGFLDQSTRQYRVFLEVHKTDEQAVLSGDFLRAVLTGRVVKDTLSVPETALTRAGHVWFVDQNDQLLRVVAEVMFRRTNHVVIKAPGDSQTWRLAITPLASFLPGQRVAPHVVKD